jgi:hypothetical protein
VQGLIGSNKKIEPRHYNLISDERGNMFSCSRSIFFYAFKNRWSAWKIQTVCTTSGGNSPLQLTTLGRPAIVRLGSKVGHFFLKRSIVDSIASEFQESPLIIGSNRKNFLIINFLPGRLGFVPFHVDVIISFSHLVLKIFRGLIAQPERVILLRPVLRQLSLPLDNTKVELM